MRLLIDVGNTRIKGALEDEGDLQLLPALSYQGASLGELLSAWDSLPEISSCWVASVGHADICAAIASFMKDRFAVEAVFASSTAESCGVKNAYAQPGNLGVDRLLGMVAVKAKSAVPAVIVSAGTAVTIDVVDADGQHRGGLIAPGLSTQRKAMLEHTQVRADTSGQALEWLGDSTDACVTLGTLHTVLGYIERVTGRLKMESPDLSFVISGGDAEQLLPHLGEEWAHSPMLVLEGLAVMAESAS